MQNEELFKTFRDISIRTNAMKRNSSNHENRQKVTGWWEVHVEQLWIHLGAVYWKAFLSRLHRLSTRNHVLEYRQMTVLIKISNMSCLWIKGGNTSWIVLLVNPKGRFFIFCFVLFLIELAILVIILRRNIDWVKVIKKRVFNEA